MTDSLLLKDDWVVENELARLSGLTASELGELVEYGALDPVEVRHSQRFFKAEWVAPLRVAGRVRRDFDLDLFAIGVLLGYLKKIEDLERELRLMRAHMATLRAVH